MTKIQINDIYLAILDSTEPNILIVTNVFKNIGQETSVIEYKEIIDGNKEEYKLPVKNNLPEDEFLNKFKKVDLSYHYRNKVSVIEYFADIYKNIDGLGLICIQFIGYDESEDIVFYKNYNAFANKTKYIKYEDFDKNFKELTVGDWETLVSFGKAEKIITEDKTTVYARKRDN